MPLFEKRPRLGKPPLGRIALTLEVEHRDFAGANLRVATAQALRQTRRLVAQASDRSWIGLLLTLAVAAAAFVSRLNPLWLLLAGGILGFAGVI